MAARRIDPQQAHEHMESPSGALLVCAYDDDRKFEKNLLEGAIPLSELQAREDSISKDRELIFYCA